MVITEPVEPSARLLGLGSEMYPSNMQRMLSKDQIRFRQSLYRVHQSSKPKKDFVGRVPLELSIKKIKYDSIIPSVDLKFCDEYVVKRFFSFFF